LDDFLIANINALNEALNDVINQDNDNKKIVFIDVSGHKDKPDLIAAGSEEYLKLVQMAKDLHEEFKNYKEDHYAKHLSMKSGWNMTTIFGLCLGYPVVYWYKDLDQCSNCLSCLELLNVEVVKHEKTISSFTVPKDLLRKDETSHIKNIMVRWKAHISSVDGIVINEDTVVLDTIVM
jgi:hypothetical protein